MHTPKLHFNAKIQQKVQNSTKILLRHKIAPWQPEHKSSACAKGTCRNDRMEHPQAFALSQAANREWYIGVNFYYRHDKCQ